MNNASWNEFEQRVSVEELLHVAIEPLAWPMPQALALALAERNGNALAAIAALEERRVETPDDDNPLVQEMRRMDAKLTALVDIVNRLLVPPGTLPVQRLVRFNARGAVLAADVALPGDAVLLSPACASWDMFDNFEQRGRVFKEIVNRFE